MFQLILFTENQTDKTVKVIVEYDLLKGGTNRAVSIHPNKDIASKWIHKVMADYIKSHLKNYVQHKIILQKTSNSWCYKEDLMYKTNILDKCITEMQFCLDSPLAFICHSILRNQILLKEILPLENNINYNNQLFNLNSMIEFSNEFIHGPKKQL